MDRRLLFPAVAVTALAQQISPAAAEAEAAVRVRAQQFLQLELEGKFRQAEAMVAEDSKDLFYNAAKPSLQSFVIDTVEMKDDKTVLVTIKARVVITLMGAPPQILELPSRLNWRQEHGEWMYFVDVDAMRETPFGKVGGQKGDSGSTGAAMPPGLPVIHPGMTPDGAPASMDNIVSLDRNSVLVNDAMPAQTVSVRNGLPGPVDVALAETSPHLTVDIGKPHLAAGEAGEIRLTWKDRTIGTYHAYLAVSPTGQRVEIEVIAK